MHCELSLLPCVMCMNVNCSSTKITPRHYEHIIFLYFLLLRKRIRKRRKTQIHRYHFEWRKRKLTALISLRVRAKSSKRKLPTFNFRNECCPFEITAINETAVKCVKQKIDEKKIETEKIKLKFICDKMFQCWNTYKIS